ncbi:MAG: riboflavin biosynthesis protein RibF [Prevotella sp.]|nr:riboflavin biosynthesis protein RibF [Prevotella sp.]
MKTIILSSETKLTTPCVATIGSFDGVHRGHQLVVRLLIDRAKRQGLSPVVITFDRQPRQLFDQDFRPQLLSTLEEKASCLQALGIETLVVLPFTKEMAALSAEAFMRQVLCRQLNVQVLLTGYDNRFGHNRSEGFDDYVRYGKAMEMEVVRGDVELMDGATAVSSTAIRRLLSDEGRVDLMPDVLTRYYALSGHIVPGEHIGHELGFPTANLAPDDPFKLIPASGVYAVWASIADGGRMPAMMNIGTRPTFEGHRQTLEVHILKEVGDIYGQTLTVEFVSRLRSERRFDSREALVEQLRQDRESVFALLESL